MFWAYLSRSLLHERHRTNHTKRSGANDAMWRTASSDDGSAWEDSRSLLYRTKAKENVLHLSEPNHKSYEGRISQMKGKMYGIGVLLVVFGGAGLAEHITSGRGSFPFSAILFGLGFVLVLMSYGHEKKNRKR